MRGAGAKSTSVVGSFTLGAMCESLWGRITTVSVPRLSTYVCWVIYGQEVDRYWDRVSNSDAAIRDYVCAIKNAYKGFSLFGILSHVVLVYGGEDGLSDLCERDFLVPPEMRLSGRQV